MAWVVNRIRLSREQTVDAEVVHLVGARKPYMSALLEMASGGTGPALGAAPTFLKERQLAQRIELLVKEVTMSKARLFTSLIAIIGLLILAGGVGIWAFPLRAPAQAAGSSQPAETPPKLITKVRPVYPPEAKKAGIQGIVVLRTTIEKDGSVSHLEVVSGEPILAKAALEAVQQWRYAPVEKALTTDVDVNFTLAKSGAAPPAEQPSAKITKEVPPPAETAPKLITKVRPIYPPEAKKAGIEGTVVLRATIGKDGSVSDLVVLSGDPQLVRAAMDAVQQWRYLPGEEVRAATVTVNFSLAKGSATTLTQQAWKEAAPPAKTAPKLVTPGEGGIVGGNVGGYVIGGMIYTVGHGVSAPIPIYKPVSSLYQRGKGREIGRNRNRFDYRRSRRRRDRCESYQTLRQGADGQCRGDN